MSEPMLLLIAVVGDSFFSRRGPKEADRWAPAVFSLLLAGLAIIEVISGSFAR